MQNVFLEEYPDILTPYEVIEILGVGKNMVYDLLNSGRLPGIRLGRNWRITKQSLLIFLNL